MADKEPSRETRELAAQIERDGGRILAPLQEPVGRALADFLPLAPGQVRGQPVPARLSPTHSSVSPSRSSGSDRFVDPIVINLAASGV